MKPFGHNKHGPKIGEGSAPFWRGGVRVPIYHKVAWAESYLHTKWHLDRFSHLAATDMGQNWGLCPPL